MLAYYQPYGLAALSHGAYRIPLQPGMAQGAAGIKSRVLLVQITSLQ